MDLSDKALDELEARLYSFADDRGDGPNADMAMEAAEAIASLRRERLVLRRAIEWFETPPDWYLAAIKSIGQEIATDAPGLAKASTPTPEAETELRPSPSSCGDLERY